MNLTKLKTIVSIITEIPIATMNNMRIRMSEVSDSRHLFCLIAKKRFGKKIQQICLNLETSNTANIFYAIKIGEKKLKTDIDFKHMYNLINSKIDE